MSSSRGRRGTYLGKVQRDVQPERPPTARRLRVQDAVRVRVAQPPALRCNGTDHRLTHLDKGAAWLTVSCQNY